MLKPALIALLIAVPPLSLAAQDNPAGSRTRFGEHFRKADADGSGTLSRTEAEKGAPRLARQFDAIDANRDGQIAPEEIRVWRRKAKGEQRARREAAPAKFDRHFAGADADGDGALSRAEAQKSMPRVAKKFERIDADHDGRITREEMRAWLTAKRSVRTGRS